MGGKPKASDTITGDSYDIGANAAVAIAERLSKDGPTLDREEIGMLASGFTVGAASVYAEQAASRGECPNCARIEFLMTAQSLLGDAVAKLTDAVPEHGKAH